MSGDQQYNHDHDNQSSIFFPSGNSSDVNSKIMLIAIITLSTVVVVVVMLHVYVRYILRRQARARVAFRGIGLVAHVELEPPKRGLEPAVIASLPILKYVDTYHGPDNSQANPECTICIGSFEDGHMIRVLPTCKHHFHAECIDKWLESHSSCPVCRHEVELISPLPHEPVTRSRAGAGPTSAPPLESTILVSNGGAMEGTSNVTTLQSPVKVNGTVSRLSSFRRMLSMDRSSLRNDSCTQDGIDDLESQ